MKIINRIYFEPFVQFTSLFLLLSFIYSFFWYLSYFVYI